MKDTSKKRMRFLSLLLAVLMVFAIGGTGLPAAAAEGDAEESSATESSTPEAAVSAVPGPSASFYIHDEEKLLSTDTKNEILSRNKTLYEKYGIQIVVLTLETLPGKDINAKGAYLHQVIDSWQVGGTAKKALVLALSATEQNYVAVAGDGLKEAFPAITWTELFNQHLEPDFVAQQYDAGVLKLFKAIADKAELHAVNASMSAAGDEETASPEPSAKPEKEKEEKENQEKSGALGVILRVILGIIFAALVIVVIGFIVIYVHGQMVRKKRREARRRRAMQERAQQNDGRSPTQNHQNSDYNDFINRY